MSYKDVSEKGVISHHKFRARDYIQCANNEIDKIEKNKRKSFESAAIAIRKAIECIVHEVLLKGIKPDRQISWDNLKKIKPSPCNIDKLQTIYSNISSKMHINTKNDNNPATITKYKEDIQILNTIINQK